LAVLHSHPSIFPQPPQPFFLPVFFSHAAASPFLLYGSSREQASSHGVHPSSPSSPWSVLCSPRNPAGRARMELPRLPRLELDQGRALHCCSPRAGGFPQLGAPPWRPWHPCFTPAQGPQPPLLSTAPWPPLGSTTDIPPLGPPFSPCCCSPQSSLLASSPSCAGHHRRSPLRAPFPSPWLELEFPHGAPSLSMAASPCSPFSPKQQPCYSLPMAPPPAVPRCACSASARQNACERLGVVDSSAHDAVDARRVLAVLRSPSATPSKTVVRNPRCSRCLFSDVCDVR
jgi:hypothetical protein